LHRLTCLQLKRDGVIHNESGGGGFDDDDDDDDDDKLVRV